MAGSRGLSPIGRLAVGCWLDGGFVSVVLLVTLAAGNLKIVGVNLLQGVTNCVLLAHHGICYMDILKILRKLGCEERLVKEMTKYPKARCDGVV